uniref:Uncharacterized protein n=1 Tax=Zea mays TaxID=4577 RepID=A0A804UCN1_MAIZE
MLLHAHVLRRHPVRQPPREPVHQVRHAGGDQLHGEIVRGADASAGPERQQLEVRPAHVHSGGSTQEPLRLERVGRVGPRRRVARDGPRVHQHARARGDVVAGHHRALAGVVRDEERADRVQPQRLLHDGVDVVELRQVALRDPAPTAYDAVELIGGLGHGLRVSQKLRHGPLDRHRRALRATGDDVLDEGLDAVAREPGLRLRLQLRALLAELQQHVDEVSRHKLAAGSLSKAPPFFVVDEDLLVEMVVKVVQTLHLPLEPLHVEPAQPRHPLADVADRAGRRERLVQRAPERLALGAAVAARPLLADRHAEDVPHRGAGHVLPDGDGAAPGGAPEQAARE